MKPELKVASRRVPFLDLAQLYQEKAAEFDGVFQSVGRSASFIGGETLQRFESEFSGWHGPGYSTVGCGNGTDAITLAVRALNLPKDSEAIIPAMTFVATAEGLINAGVKVKLVDVHRGTWLMDAQKIEEAMTSRTRLIVPVHLYGQMAEMDVIKDIADRYHCKVLEDAAQAHGATWKGKKVGFYGDIASYSFFPGKNLGAFGDGGAVVSRNPDLIAAASAWGKHGGLKKYEHNFAAFNSRLDTLQAGILSVKLKYIDTWNGRRRQVADLYRAKLAKVAAIDLPLENREGQGVYHLFVITTPDRSGLQNFLRERNIETGIHYPLAIHQLPAFQKTEVGRGSFPHSEYIAAHGLSLPMGPTLTNADAEYVADSVVEYFEG